MIRRTTCAIGAAFSLLLLGGCSGMASGPDATPSLDGTAWVLAELPGQSVTQPGNVTLQFTGDRASGSDGCNRFSGGFKGAGSSLQFSQLASTQMACEPAVMEQAGLVTRALGSARSYRIDGERLELRDGDGKTVAVYQAQSTRLEGTAWNAVGINNGKGAVASLVAETIVTLEFGSEARAAGSAGCNRYHASYAADRESLRFGAPASTRMMCGAPGVMEQEQAFLRALQQVTTMRMEGDRLELRAADGALQVSLRRAAPQP